MDKIACIILLSIIMCLMTIGLAQKQHSSVPKPPLIIVHPNFETTFKDKEKMQIPCVATGEPTPIYLWKKNGQNLTFNGLDMSQLPDSGTLMIKTPTINDEGIYQCFAINQYGVSSSVKALLKIAVHEPFPTVKEPQLHRPVIGASLTIRCNPPQSYPSALVYWGENKDKDKFKPIENTERVSLDYDGNLHFSNIVAEDSMNGVLYVCMSKNSFLRSVAQGDDQKIMPERKPGMPRNMNPSLMWSSPVMDTALRMQTKQMKCIFSGYPTPNVSWVRIGENTNMSRVKVKSFGQEIEIQNIQYSDAGKYRCIATNAFDGRPMAHHDITLSVESTPYWKDDQPPEDVNTSEEENAEFHCNALGTPKPKITWLINGVPVDEMTPNSRPKKGPHILKFENVAKADAQVIQCNASNKHGYIFANAYLNVFAEAPYFKITPEASVKVAEGKSAVIKCNSFGAPKPKISWKFNATDGSKTLRQIDSNDKAYSIESSGNLKIHKVSLSDDGIYECNASNKFGNEIAAGRLLIRHKTKILSAPPENQILNASTLIVLHCNATTDPEEKTNLKIDWYKDDEKIDFTATTGITKNVRDNSLIFTQATVEDSGEFKCIASNGLDNDTAITTLTIKDRPNPPYDVRLVSCTPTLAEISWEPGFHNNDPILGYNVYYNTSYDEKDVLRVSEHKVPAIRYSFRFGLEPYTNYTFHVRAYNSLGLGDPSYFTYDVCSTPPMRPKRNPRKVCTQSRKPGVLTIIWEPMLKTEQNGPNFYYLVNYKSLKTGESNQKRLDWTHKELEVDGFDIFEEFEISVQSVNDLGASPEIEKKIGYSGQGLPSVKPRNMRIKDNTLNATSATFVWDAVDDSVDKVQGFFRGYQLLLWKTHEPSSLRTQDIILNVWNPCRNLPNDPSVQRRSISRHRYRRKSGNEVVAHTTQLWPYSDISVAALVLNGGGRGTLGESFAFRTPEGVPSEVVDLKVVERGSHHFKVEWKPPHHLNGEHIGYELEYKKAPPAIDHRRTVQINGISKTRKKILGLEPDTPYLIYICAKTNAGRGEEIFVEDKTLEPSPPSKPHIDDINIGDDFVNISWNPTPKEETLLTTISPDKSGGPDPSGVDTSNKEHSDKDSAEKDPSDKYHSDKNPSDKDPSSEDSSIKNKDKSNDDKKPHNPGSNFFVEYRKLDPEEIEDKPSENGMQVTPPNNDIGRPGENPDAMVISPDGKPVLDEDGKPVIPNDGMVIGPDEKPVLDKNGNPLRPEGGLEMGPDGRPVFNQEQDPVRPESGNIIGPDGKPILGHDGKPVMPEKGMVIGPDGRPAVGPDGRPVRAHDGLIINPDGKPLLDKDNRPLGPNRKPILPEEFKVTPDGKLIDKNGDQLPDGIKKGSDGKPINRYGIPNIGQDGKPIDEFNRPISPDGPGGGMVITPSGNPLLDENKRPIVPNGGMLIDPEGKPVLDSKGNPIRPDNGLVLAPDGKPVFGPDNKPISPEGGLKIGSDGKPELKSDGYPVRPQDGNIIGPDGRPVLGNDKNPIYPEPGTIIGPNGKPVEDPNGHPLRPDKAMVIGPDGKPVFGLDGHPVRAHDGLILAPDGKPLVDENNRPLGPNQKPILPEEYKVSPDGKLLDKDGNPIPDGIKKNADGEPLNRYGIPLISSDGKPLDQFGRPIGPGGGMVISPGGNPLLDENKKPVVPNGGMLLDPEGRPVLDPNGKPVKPENGLVLGPDGKPIFGPDDKPISPVGGLQIGPDGKPELKSDGNPIRPESGNIIGPDGLPVIDNNGKPVHPESGMIIAPNGKPVEDFKGRPLLADKAMVLDPHGKPIVGLDGRPVRAHEGMIIAPDGKPLTDKDGRPLGPDNEPILPEEIKVNPSGKLVDENGNPLQDGILKNSDGKPINKYTKPNDVGGMVVDQDGKPILDKDNKPVRPGGGVQFGPNGKPIMNSDGSPVRPRGGQIIGPDKNPVLGPDGKPIIPDDGMIIGPDGRPIIGPDGQPARAHNGMIIGPDGKPLVDSDNRPLGPDLKPIFPDNIKIRPDGKLTNDGRPLTREGMLLDSNKKPINKYSKPDGGMVITPDNKPIIGPNGRPVNPEGGMIIGPDGKPKLDQEGNLIRPDNGMIIGPNNKPINGQDGNPIRPDGGMIIGPGGKPVNGPDGRPARAQNGMIIGPDAKPLLSSDNRPLGPDKKPIYPEGYTIGPDGKLVDKEGNQQNPNGMVIGPDGNPVNRYGRPNDADIKPAKGGRRKGGKVWEKIVPDEDQNWLNISNLEPGATYDFIIVAVNHAGDETRTEPKRMAIVKKSEVRAHRGAMDFLWWILLLLLLLLLLLICIIFCCIRCTRGAVYAVYEKEKLRGTDSLKDDDARFGEYMRTPNTELKYAEEKPALKSGSIDSIEKPLTAGLLGDANSETDSLGEYEDPDPSKFNEDGSFIGQYGGHKKSESGAVTETATPTVPNHGIIV